jgi:hypothetical protein
MIISVEELRNHITTNKEDKVLEDMLQALELLIRKYTNNNFQKRAYRREADIIGNIFVVEALTPFKIGDTVQVSESGLNEGLYTIIDTTDSTFTTKEDVADELGVLVTKVEYPMDVKMGVINMMKWDLENRSKVGIQSETISRHSVTYFNMDGDNSIMGYPKSLLGFLKPYKKARF